MSAKNIIGILLVLGLIGGCSSVDVEKDNQPTAAANTETKSAKKRVREIAYDSLKDYYSDWNAYGIDGDVIIQNENGMLLKETLQPLGKDDLRKIADNTDGDPLMILSSFCYLKDFETAAQKLLKYNRQYRKNPAFWNIMGNCYYLGGHLLKSKLYYNKALELDETYSPAISNLGVLYMREGRDQKALSAWLKVYKSAGFSLTPLANLSRLYLKYAYYEKAQKMLETLVERSRDDVALKNDLATSYLMAGDLDKAYKIYRTIPANKLRKRIIGVNYLLTLKLLGKQSEALNLLESMGPLDVGGGDKRFRDYYYKVEKFVKQ